MSIIKNQYKIGENLLCKVTRVHKNFFEVVTLNKHIGKIYVKEISDYYVKDLISIVKIGDVLYLTLKSFLEDGTLLFSFKENRSYFLRTPFEFKISESNEEKKGFEKLFDFVNEEIKKWKT